jgi:hypothetical protein
VQAATPPTIVTSTTATPTTPKVTFDFSFLISKLIAIGSAKTEDQQSIYEEIFPKNSNVEETNKVIFAFGCVLCLYYKLPTLRPENNIVKKEETTQDERSSAQPTFTALVEEGKISPPLWFSYCQSLNEGLIYCIKKLSPADKEKPVSDDQVNFPAEKATPANKVETKLSYNQIDPYIKEAGKALQNYKDKKRKVIYWLLVGLFPLLYGVGAVVMDATSFYFLIGSTTSITVSVLGSIVIILGLLALQILLLNRFKAWKDLDIAPKAILLVGLLLIDIAVIVGCFVGLSVFSHLIFPLLFIAALSCGVFYVDFISCYKIIPKAILDAHNAISNGVFFKRLSYYLFRDANGVKLSSTRKVIWATVAVVFCIFSIGAGITTGMMVFHYTGAFLAAMGVSCPPWVMILIGIAGIFIAISAIVLFLKSAMYFFSSEWLESTKKFFKSLTTSGCKVCVIFVIFLILISLLVVLFGLVCMMFEGKICVENVFTLIGAGAKVSFALAIAFAAVCGIGGEVPFVVGTLIEWAKSLQKIDTESLKERSFWKDKFLGWLAKCILRCIGSGGDFAITVAGGEALISGVPGQVVAYASAAGGAVCDLAISSSDNEKRGGERGLQISPKKNVAKTQSSNEEAPKVGLLASSGTSVSTTEKIINKLGFSKNTTRTSSSDEEKSEEILIVGKASSNNNLYERTKLAGIQEPKPLPSQKEYVKPNNEDTSIGNLYTEVEKLYNNLSK